MSSASQSFPSELRALKIGTRLGAAGRKALKSPQGLETGPGAEGLCEEMWLCVTHSGAGLTAGTAGSTGRPAAKRCFFTLHANQRLLAAFVFTCSISAVRWWWCRGRASTRVTDTQSYALCQAPCLTESIAACILMLRNMQKKIENTTSDTVGQAEMRPPRKRHEHTCKPRQVICCRLGI